MKLLIGFGLGVCLTGALVILYFSLPVRDSPFLSGFISATVFFMFSLLAIHLWNRKPSDKAPVHDLASTDTHRRKNRNKAASLFSLLAGLLVVFLFFKQNAQDTSKTRLQKIEFARKAELIETTRNSGLAKWMALVLQQADVELKKGTVKTLSDETIARVSALSYSFKPYTHVIGDSISETQLSPERGQLLMVLCRMGMDSVSFTRLMRQASFSGADLREADLNGANLRGVDLKGADLHGANLEGSDLKGADLSFANLWGANLNGASMKGVVAKRTDFRWAEMNGVDLHKADLHEADLTSAKLRKADISESILQWADFTGAFLNEANLSGADMFRVELKRAQLEGAILKKANLTLAGFVEANLNGSNLSDAELKEAVVPDLQWLLRLDEWHVTGAAAIQETYKITDQSSKEQTLFQLRKIEN